MTKHTKKTKKGIAITIMHKIIKNNINHSKRFFRIAYRRKVPNRFLVYSNNNNDNKCFIMNSNNQRYFSSKDDIDEEDDDDNDNMDMEGTPFPKLGWSPGSFGSRALRKSTARKPGEPTGRTKPKKTEEDYWLEAYEAYGVPSRASTSDDDNNNNNIVEKKKKEEEDD